MSGDRKSISMPDFNDDMSDFKPRVPRRAGGASPAPKLEKKAIDAVSSFPSREAPAEGQLNLKGPMHILNRFKAMCKDDRRAYYDMLQILMDRYEGKS